MDDLLEQTLGTESANEGAPMSNVQNDYYRVLDIPCNANRLEVREAYLKMKGTYGAGSAALYSLIDEDEAQRHLADIEEAFRTLNDDHLRRAYDEKMGVNNHFSDGTRQGASSMGGSAMETGSGDTERFLRMREAASTLSAQVSGPLSEPMFGEEGAARTYRSLAGIKLRATMAGSSEMHEQMRELIAGHDAGDGDLYRQLRELCQVSADELQERTKVSIGYIEAIETNRFERLPQVVYVKGFLASCFRYLDVPNHDKLIAAFAARLTDWQANKKN